MINTHLVKAKHSTKLKWGFVPTKATAVFNGHEVELIGKFG
jgi:hypothetical protein